MPRKLAAERYSPDTAAAFHHGEIAREATYRSEVVRANRTPHSSDAHCPERHRRDGDDREGHSSRMRSRNDSIERVGTPLVDRTDHDEHRERGRRDQPGGEWNTEQRDVRERRDQREQQRQRPDHASEGNEAEQRQLELRAPQLAEVQLAVSGVLGELVTGSASSRW